MKLGIFFTTLFFLFNSPIAHAQSQDVRDTGELVRRYEKEGQMFTIRIVPKGKSIDVFVVGYKTAGVKFNDVGLEAYANLAGKTYELNVTKENNLFKIEKKHTEPFTLDLKLKGKEKTESMKFEVP